MLMRGSRWWTGGPDPPPPPEKSQKQRILEILVQIPWKKTQSYQVSIQIKTDVIGPPAKRHLIGVPLADPWWPAYSGILIFPPLIS